MESENSKIIHEVNDKLTLMMLQSVLFEKQINQSQNLSEAKLYVRNIKSNILYVHSGVSQLDDRNEHEKMDMADYLNFLKEHYNATLFQNLTINLNIFANPIVHASKYKFLKLIMAIFKFSKEHQASEMQIHLRKNSLHFHDDGGKIDSQYIYDYKNLNNASGPIKNAYTELFNILDYFNNECNWRISLDNIAHQERLDKKMGIVYKFIFPKEQIFDL